MKTKTFMGDDFLLPNELAVTLFEETKNLPIIDYHCHLDPKEIADNRRFENLTQLWLGGDHYKWRLMRANGVSERFITGDATDYEKFEKWAQTLEDAIGSPLYHWTHLELKRYFNCDLLLSQKTAKAVWDACQAVIDQEDFTVFGILKKFNVESLCTTDDPADSLSHHIAIAKSGIACKVLPTLRPSKALAIESPSYVSYIQTLETAAGTKITGYKSLVEALAKRVEFFDQMGCKLSDHALDPVVFELPKSEQETEDIVKAALQGKTLSAQEANKYKTALLLDMGRLYAKHGWTMQLHMNAQRNNNARMFKQLGADTGYDSIMDTVCTVALSQLLNALDATNELPKTILYSLNPAADDALATMCGNFQGGGIRGKVQFGSAWWFNDTLSGMRKQMTTLANLGMLSTFVGMLTDSRSFLSYTRHEYFRRIVAGLLATWVENGEFPNDIEKLTEIAKNISYLNAKNYFNF